MYNELFFLFLVCIFWWWFIENLSSFPQDSQNIQTNANSSQQSAGSQSRTWLSDWTDWTEYYIILSKEQFL